jgi:pyridoxine/pyridoxamine 5'-phosphate oxidase
MSFAVTDLEELPATIWRDLEAAAENQASPFRTPVLGTTNLFECAMRVVVLRQADAAKRELVCYSDARAQKVHQLKLCEQGHWLFHDPVRRMQLRISAHTMVHQNDAIALAHWAKTPLAHRRNYCANQPPGSDIHAPGDAISPELKSPKVTAKQLEQGYENFAVLVSTVDQIEFLQLADEGNVRAVFNWTVVKWSGLWLVP